MSSNYSPEYLAQSRQASLYTSEIITYVAAFVAVGLRLWARKLQAVGFWLDDWLVLTAMIGATAMLVNMMWWISIGYGKHREANGPNGDYNFFLAFFMAEIIYTFIIVFVKYSILALYWRIFGKVAMRWPVWILTAVVTSWGIAVFLLSIFACIPTNAFWDKTVENYECGVDFKKFLWGLSIPNIATDVALLLLPIPYVMGLKTHWEQKRLIIGTFFLGGFVCIASIVRLVVVCQQDQGPDASWNWVDQGIWAPLECNFAIISACLPALRPIWVRLFRASGSTQASSVATPRSWGIGTPKSSKRGHRKLPDESLLDNSHAYSTRGFDDMLESDGIVSEEGKRYSYVESTIAAPEKVELRTLRMYA